MKPLKTKKHISILNSFYSYFGIAFFLKIVLSFKLSFIYSINMKRIQLEPWTTWEKLCLANAVQRTGDQNWTAVGRAVKNIYDDTMAYLGNEARPSHWFSMKQCAAQYETLLNSVLGSRRKKRTDKSADPHEQPSHLIYNILKNEFLDELDRKIDEDRIMYKKMKKKQEDILSGLYDDKLEEMLAEDVREKERDIKMKLKFKLGEKNAERNANTIKTYPPTTPENEIVKTPGSNSSTSPLLTSLLQSPSQHSLPSTPSISLLLNSTPSTPSNESPTLSKLLESPSSKVPLNASSSLTPSALPAVTPPPTISPISNISQVDMGLRSHLKSVASTPSSEPTRRQFSPQKPLQLPSTPTDGIHSEIVIEEELVGKDKKQIKKSDNEGEEEEVIESVEEILEKLKESIIETVGGNEQDLEVITEQVHQTEVGMEHSAVTSDKDEEEQEDEEEVEEMDVEEQEIPESHSQNDEDEGTQDKPDEEEPTVQQPDEDEHDKVFDDDDDKIDADILAEAKSVVDRRLSDSEVQDLGELSSDQMMTKTIKLRDSDSNIEQIIKEDDSKQQDYITKETDSPILKPKKPDSNYLDSEQNVSEVVRQDESSTRDNERESDDNVEIGCLDQEAVEIIVMGSNTNSVVNVLSQDSSSEELVQGSCNIQETLKGSTEPEDTEETRTSGKEEEDEDEESDDEKPSVASPSGGEEESQSSVGTEGKTHDDKDDDDDKEEDKEELSSKEEYMQEDGSSKDGHASSRDEGGDSSSVPDTMADQETTSDSAIAQPSPPHLSISVRENMPEVKITLEPLEISTLSQGSFKDEIKNAPALEKIRRQSSRKRSSAHLDSKPTSPASTSFGEDEKEYRAWKKSVLLVFSRIASHKYASVFSKPITDTAGYKAIIKCPMDLSTIKRNIETGVIRSTLDFQRDIMLMIQNAVIYNAHDSPVYSMAIEMWHDVLSQMNVMVQAVGDGVLLGDPVVQGDTPSRPSRHAKLSLDNKKSSHTPPSHATPKRRKI